MSGSHRDQIIEKLITSEVIYRNSDGIYTLDQLIEAYKMVMSWLDSGESPADEDRAIGGIQRAFKGAFVEFLAKNLVRIAWHNLGGSTDEISYSGERIRVELREKYLDKLEDNEIKEHIVNNRSKYHYKYQIDVPVYVKGELALAIECKAYAENAMLKRILLDGMLIKSVVKDTEIVLFQLESQLGGDYSEVFKDKFFGSPSSNTLMSFFDYKLHILTILEGERNINKPIHKEANFKIMQKEALERGVSFFENLLARHK